MSDVSPSNRPAGSRFRPFAELLVALAFLSRLPVPFLRTIDPPPLASAMRQFPIAGALLGLISGAILVAAKFAGLPALLAASLTLAAMVLLTGALHEDGLADVADGFGGGGSREEKLAIMRDSRIGTYGTIALLLAFLARAAILAEFYYRAPLEILLVLIGAAAFSRALLVDLLWATRPARLDGLSVKAGRPERIDALIALGSGGVLAVLCFANAISVAAAVLALVAGGLALGIVRSLAMRMIGGQTGDVCGAAQVVCEIAILGAAIAMLR
jgi:adenosylcobinamide-GDP ribazoletransferase